MARTAEIGAAVAQISPLNRILLSPFWTAKCRLQRHPQMAQLPLGERNSTF